MARCAPRRPGNTGGTAWVVLEGPRRRRSTSTPPPTKPGASEPRLGRGLRRAPVVLLAYASPDAYVARYARDRQGATRLGLGRPRLGRSRTGSATPPSGSWRSCSARSTPVSAPASSAPSGASTGWPRARGPRRMAAVRRRGARPARRRTTAPPRSTGPGPARRGSTGAAGGMIGHLRRPSAGDAEFTVGATRPDATCAVVLPSVMTTSCPGRRRTAGWSTPAAAPPHRARRGSNVPASSTTI